MRATQRRPDLHRAQVSWAGSGDYRQRRAVLAAVLGPIIGLLAGAFFWQVSFAERSAETTSPGNGWRSGVVKLSDGTGSALFSVPTATPRSPDARCIKVTYDGDVAAHVRLAADVDGALAPHLDWEVDEGSGGGAGGSCEGFTPSTSPAYRGTLAGFATDHPDYESGWGGFAPDGAGASRVYRFRYAVADTDDAQNTDATFTLRWEARTR